MANEITKATGHQDMARAIRSETALQPGCRTSATLAGRPESDEKALVNAVFARLHLIYGHRWLSIYRSDDLLERAKREWRTEIARLTDEQCERALDRCKRSAVNVRGEAWPPSLPEFIELTRPTRAELGIPEDELAYLEASRVAGRTAGHDWSHRAVFYAGQAVGWYEMANAHPRDTRPAFMAAYRTIVGRLRNGESLLWLAPPPDDHEESRGQPLTEEQREALRAELRGLVTPHAEHATRPRQGAEITHDTCDGCGLLPSDCRCDSEGETA